MTVGWRAATTNIFGASLFVGFGSPRRDDAPRFHCDLQVGAFTAPRRSTSPSMRRALTSLADSRKTETQRLF